jgi:hypothetical protein
MSLREEDEGYVLEIVDLVNEDVAADGVVEVGILTRGIIPTFIYCLRQPSRSQVLSSVHHIHRQHPPSLEHRKGHRHATIHHHDDGSHPNRALQILHLFNANSCLYPIRAAILHTSH